MKMKVIFVSVVLVIGATIADIVTNQNDQDFVARNLSLSHQITQMLDFFNVERVANSWVQINSQLSRNCSQDMEKYFQGLSDQQLWALKS